MDAMPEEPVVFKTADGESGPAVAEIAYYGSAARISRAILYIVAGFVGGAACIIVPVVHLLTTWGLPLVGILMGVRALRTHQRIVTVAGPCPGCGEPVDLPGGSMTDAGSCTACKASLTIILPDAPGAAGRPATPNRGC